MHVAFSKCYVKCPLEVLVSLCRKQAVGDGALSVFCSLCFASFLHVVLLWELWMKRLCKRNTLWTICDTRCFRISAAFLILEMCMPVPQERVLWCCIKVTWRTSDLLLFIPELVEFHIHCLSFQILKTGMFYASRMPVTKENIQLLSLLLLLCV